ncbi:hypothetical protein TNIN_69761 [Trichonephila inaurata madagascariensis]|uniref:Uncharacterized protein n=1 Tax=Trichonephila inaurata madagascariensis TaxID=2747483 RepID=A0A8X6XX00_9ARAC|nr:hypothetical protein TNIN_69761 [Trichonephila inaurata madagascariensis]
MTDFCSFKTTTFYLPSPLRQPLNLYQQARRQDPLYRRRQRSRTPEGPCWRGCTYSILGGLSLLHRTTLNKRVRPAIKSPSSQSEEEIKRITSAAVKVRFWKRGRGIKPVVLVRASNFLLLFYKGKGEERGLN